MFNKHDKADNNNLRYNPSRYTTFVHWQLDFMGLSTVKTSKSDKYHVSIDIFIDILLLRIFMFMFPKPHMWQLF